MPVIVPGFLRSVRSAPRNPWALISAAALSMLVLPGAAMAATGYAKMAPDLARQARQYPRSNAKKRVIVQMDAAALGKGSAEKLARMLGGARGAKLGLVSGIALDIPYHQLVKLANTKWVRWVSPDRTVITQW